MSALRPIANMPGLVDTFGGQAADRPELLWIDPADLLVDESYQRGLARRSVELIRRICADWSWARFKPPVVVRDGDGFHILDGQHTALAAHHHPGVAKIPVLVVEAKDTAARARAFLGHNRDRVAMTPMQLFHSAVVAGDADAVAAHKACEAVGVTVLRVPPAYGRYRPGETVAAASIVALLKRIGPAPAKAVLGVLVDAKAAPLLAAQIRAVEELLFGDCAPVDRTDLASVIRGRPHYELMAKAEGRKARTGEPAWTCLAEIYRAELTAPRAVQGRAL